MTTPPPGGDRSLAAHDASYYEDDRLWGQEAILKPEHVQLRLDATHDLLPPRLARVLDVGAGDGRVVDDLAARPDGPGLVVALDRSSTALRHVGAPAVAATGAQLPFGDRCFDAVLICEVLEHLPPPVLTDVLAEATRVADQWIFVTVPYREDRARGSVRCQVCGCTYNAFRHLRSFDDDDLVDLVPGFELVASRQAGPRAPVYPRFVRRLAEGHGLVRRSWYPTCPLCASVYDPTAGRRTLRPVPPPAARSTAAPDGPAPTPPSPSSAGGGTGLRSYHLARSLVPKARHRYWVCALYRRR